MCSLAGFFPLHQFVAGRELRGITNDKQGSLVSIFVSYEQSAGLFLLRGQL